MFALHLSKVSVSQIRHYQVLPWVTGPLTSLQSISEVPDWQVAKMGKLSFFCWCLALYCHFVRITLFMKIMTPEAQLSTCSDIVHKGEPIVLNILIIMLCCTAHNMCHLYSSIVKLCSKMCLTDTGLFLRCTQMANRQWSVMAKAWAYNDLLW